MPKINLILVACKRCGKVIYSSGHSIYGNNILYARLGSICQSCITPEEKAEIMQATAEAILKGRR